MRTQLAACLLLAACVSEQDQPVDDPLSEALQESHVNDEHQCLTAEPGEVQWHSCNGPDSVQFGQPGTDLRGVRLDCIDGKLTMAFPIPWTDEPRSKLLVDFPDGSQLRGEEIELGNGMNASVSFGDNSNLPLELAAGEYFEFTFEGQLYSFPAPAARSLVEVLARNCTA